MAERQHIVHARGPGRPGENSYIAQADPPPFGLDGQIEQLWLQPEEHDTYKVAC
ncbi:hypothetical protein KMT30_45695 [Streptomyces sp. IBSBF 2953]|nr:hypothetical protein [Streptomyces hayashii]